MAQIVVKWTKMALEDLDSARDYTAQEYPELLESTIDNLLDSVNQLLKFPAIGRIGRVRGTREFVLADIPYTIVYRQNLAVIEILSLIHHSRKWP